MIVYQLLQVDKCTFFSLKINLYLFLLEMTVLPMSLCQVWNLTNCRLKTNHYGHTAFLNCVTVSPDGSLCASGGKVSRYSHALLTVKFTYHWQLAVFSPGPFGLVLCYLFVLEGLWATKPSHTVYMLYCVHRPCLIVHARQPTVHAHLQCIKSKASLWHSVLVMHRLAAHSSLATTSYYVHTCAHNHMCACAHILYLYVHALKTMM